MPKGNFGPVLIFTKETSSFYDIYLVKSLGWVMLAQKSRQNFHFLILWLLNEWEEKWENLKLQYFYLDSWSYFCFSCFVRYPGYGSYVTNWLRWLHLHKFMQLGWTINYITISHCCHLGLDILSHNTN